MEHKTIEQKRGDILEQRLNLLNDFIILNSEGGTDSFVKYLRQKGIKKEDFIEGLPTQLQSPPAAGIEAVMDYTERMNANYARQYLEHGKKIGMPADEFSVLGEIYGNDDTWSGVDGDDFSLTAEERKAKRKAKREARKKAKDAAIKEPGDKKAMHVLNKLNPLFVLIRNSYSALVRMNMFGLATTLNKMKIDADQSYWKKVLTKWYNMGGIKNILSTSVDKGKTKPQKLRRKKLRSDGTDEDLSLTGAEEAAIITAAGTAIAAILPIIISFKKKKGISEDEGDKEMDKEKDPDDDPTTDDKPNGGDGEGMSTKMKWIIGGSIGAALLITVIIIISVRSGKGK